MREGPDAAAEVTATLTATEGLTRACCSRGPSHIPELGHILGRDTHWISGREQFRDTFNR